MSCSYSSQHLRSLWKADFDTFMALFCGSSVEGVGCCQCPGLLEIPCHWVLPLWKTLSVCCCCQPPLLDPESLLAASLSADGFKGSNWPWRWTPFPARKFQSRFEGVCSWPGKIFPIRKADQSQQLRVRLCQTLQSLFPHAHSRVTQRSTWKFQMHYFDFI